MRTKLLLTGRMSGIGSALLIFSSLFIFAGCSGHDVPASRLRDKSIESFNSGKEVEAVAWAKKLASEDSSESDFLLTQYIIYDTLEYSHRFSRISKKWYGSVVAYDLSHVAPPLRDRYIAAQVFSEIYLNSADDGLSLLNNKCKTWIALDTKSCLEKIILNAQNAFISKPSRFGAIYLFEATETGNALKLIDKKHYRYNMGLAYAAVDKRRSLGMLRYLMDSDPLSNDMMKTYCSILNMDFYDSTGKSLLGQVANLKDFQISATCPVMK